MGDRSLTEKEIEQVARIRRKIGLDYLIADKSADKQGIRIVKSCDTLSETKDAKNKLLSDLESELGRMAKLIGQLRAEFSRASD